MVDVTCPGCSASYSLSEKRIPDGGMEMRCPQCAASFRVERPNKTDPAPPRPGQRSPVPRPVPPTREKRRSLFSSRRAQPNEEFHSPAVDDLFGDADGDDDFGVIDMALPGSEIPLEGPNDFAGDLPIAAADLDLPMAAADIDLPTAAADIDLPTAVADIDLPIAVDDVGLPVAVHGSNDHGLAGGTLLPSMQHPTPSPPRPQAPPPRPSAGQTSGYRDLFQDDRREREDSMQDLPMPSELSDLPSHAQHSNLPMTTADSNLPMPALHSDLPMPADQDLPLPAPNADLPMPADFDFPSSTDRAVMSGPNPHLGDPAARPFDPNFDAFELEDDPLDRLGQTEVIPPTDFNDAGAGMAFDGAPPGQEVNLDTETSDTFGDEFDLEGAANRDGTAGDRKAPKVRIKRKTSKLSKLAFLTIPLLAVAGGMLYLVPSIGPFGAHAIGDLLNRGKHDAAYASHLTTTNEQLGMDTAADTAAALGRAKSMARDMPRYSSVVADAAFLSFWNEIRFGTGSEDVATGKQLLKDLTDADASPELELARVAQLAASGDPAQAAAQADSYVAKYADRLDGYAVAGEMALRTNKAKAALAHYKKLASIAPSALAAYGLGRAHAALDQQKEAIEQAEQALKLSKNHAGARTLLATLLWTQNNKDERPFELVGEVVAKGAVRDAASRAELVLAYSLSGEIHLSRSHMTDAEKAFAMALKMDPQSRRALLGNGELLYQAGRYSEALARFEAAHRPDPKAAMPLVGKAKTKIALERANEAKADLLPIAKASTHPLVGYWLGRAEEALGAGESAENWYRHALKVGATKPEAVHAYVALADLLGGQGRNEDADSVLADASEKLPRSIALHNARGDVALKSGRVADAKREFIAAIAIDKTFTPSRFRLATALRRNREYDAAEAALTQVVETDPEYPGLTLERGLLFEARGDTDKALSMYNEALKKAPDDVDLKLRVGSTQVVSGHPKQAKPLLREVLSKRPRSAEVNHFLGRALLLNGDYPEALRYLQAAVRYDSVRADYHLYVAWAANEAGQLAIASDAVEKALKLNQELGDAYWQRAIVQQKYGNTPDALKDLERALKRNPSRYEAYATQALCHQKLANYPAAEQSWRKAIAGNDKVASWRFRFGKVLWDKGSRDEAAKHLLAAVDLAETSKRAKGWLWNANFLLGEALRRRNPKRAIVAYRAFLRLSKTDNGYRADAVKALEGLENR